MSNKQAHLDMIQAVVNRLAHCSFLLKGWSVILASALFALGARGHNPVFAALAGFPALAFWGLDGYFLRQERLFRKLYDHVRLLNEADVDFSMDVSGLQSQVDPWLRVAFSKTLSAFHGVVAASILIVWIFIFTRG
ncbi:conserved membrane hypothetical protein [Candidatus Desulfarcum epimagneticum]|uniref:Uncharacterized protein n=1 Tax=uncultured Desulfobacteraceae bacterium TaxID=218296 RepID=A0A484HER7_9BACT|nr:conserved membrane hypothetical protein [uncultured Desulfobacteraceae bacterium]